MSALMYCDRCDGCGWYEGGKTLQTTCERCGGTGVVEDKHAIAAEPPTESISDRNARIDNDIRNKELGMEGPAGGCPEEES